MRCLKCQHLYEDAMYCKWYKIYLDYDKNYTPIKSKKCKK